MTLRIKTTALPNAVVGQPYSFTLEAEGGDGNYTWSIVEMAKIQNLTWRRTLQFDLQQRVEVAHADLTRIASQLRDAAAVEIWAIRGPQAPDTQGKDDFSVEGWHSHFASERGRVNTFHGAHAAKLQNKDPVLASAFTDYLEAMPRVVAALDSLLDQHRVAGVVQEQIVTQADRVALAVAIEAEVE